MSGTRAFAILLALHLWLGFPIALAADIVPNFEILNIASNFAPGDDGAKLREKLEKTGMVITQYDVDGWYHDKRIYSRPPIGLTRQMLGFETASADACIWYAAVLHKGSAGDFIKIGQSYNFLWLECAGKVEVLFDEHLLFRGVN